MAKNKPDLIDRTELLQVITDHAAKVGTAAPLQVAVLSWVKALVQAMPAVDAVPVVHCRDCEKWAPAEHTGLPDLGVCYLTNPMLRNACEFCDRAKRRTDHGKG